MSRVLLVLLLAIPLSITHADSNKKPLTQKLKETVCKEEQKGKWIEWFGSSTEQMLYRVKNSIDCDAVKVRWERLKDKVKKVGR